MAATNEGFKGTIVAVGSIEIVGKGSAGTVVRYHILFQDTEGATHAMAKHEVSIAETGPLTEAVKKVVDLCRQHAEQAHFENPSTPNVKQATRNGIVESLSGASDDADDPGEAG